MPPYEKPLEAYDVRRFGPLLGVSDEGSAAQTIADAAYASAKARAFGPKADAQCVGVIIDGERMTSAGEVPIGPDEYAQLLRAATGRTFCTTNIGVRVNARLDQPLPEFRIADAARDEAAWLEGIFKHFAPFVHTPDKKPRPLTVRLRVEGTECLAALDRLVPKIEAGREANLLGPSELHRLACLSVFDGEIATPAQIDWVREIIQKAAKLGVPEVAVDGKLREAARRRLSVQGVLNVLEPVTADALLTAASAAGVRLTHRFDVDEDSAARTVWTGLYSACRQGLTAAKYGLIPLTLEQQQYVVQQNQRWLADWTPIPAFYVDTPLVTQSGVYMKDRVSEAAAMWMDMAVARGAKVVLVDAPDRVEPRKLLRSNGDLENRGILTIDQVKALSAHAEALGLRVLWSGGISAAQAFELAKLQVGGIFTTSSAASKVAVHGPMISDPQLDAAVEPTDVGVQRIHALIQAGFLSTVLAGSCAGLVREIEKKASALMAAKPDVADTRQVLAALDDSLIEGWKRHWA